MAPDRCSHHEKLVVDVVKVSSTVDHLVNKFDSVEKKIDKFLNEFSDHKESSVQVRNDVKENKRFRESATTWAWGFVGAIIIIAAKTFLFP